MRKICLACILIGCCLTVFSQEKSTDKFNQKYLNWFNKDFEKDNLLGTSVDRTYSEVLSGMAPKKTIIVAVIDSGIDINHEDLQGKIWVNEGEIPGNNIDDDKNGYVDDMHGWNFIGNKNGENIAYETMEITRVYREGGSGPMFDKARELYEKELVKQEATKVNVAKFEETFYKAKSIIKAKTGVSVSSLQELNTVSSEDEQVLAAVRFLASRYENGFEDKMLGSIKNENALYLDTFLNKSFNPRTVIGDDPNNINDTGYGNPDVKGPRSDHGTSVAGVIAAIRDNDLGINGIASSVKIMCLRSTPRGDERDKDVALSIRYAVDNGAQIINMSFGKPISPQKQFVDQALKYAEEKGVLIVHGAGNSGVDIDEQEFYPSDRYTGGAEASNWLSVGASASEDNEKIASRFSNYGEKHVDLFAPGENIISTDSSNMYNMHDGTSLSAPVVTGIAALVLSYYPELTPQQLIKILLESAHKVDKKVVIPTLTEKDPKKVRFNTLSRSGGIVNAYAAIKKAGEKK